MSKTNIVSNRIINRLPSHLHQYITPQNYERYTPIDQAVWRYVMRRNMTWLREVAHQSYLKGLKQTGISSDAIPDMEAMNQVLEKIGWAAVSVDGFIPPAAFMEFQAYNVLVIASSIRRPEQIEYTPAPDIIHEAAGHAPIIANPEYAEYLRRFGEIGSKAISSAHDWELYEAVRSLSQLKETHKASPTDIENAEKRVEKLQNTETPLSEMGLIRNLHWWTVEYGLMGTLENYKIYGAGLLSSIGESKWCLSDKVKKTLYSLAAANQRFDITQPQPQLFITPNFAHLNLVLEEFANTMALRTGGLKGLDKLIASKKLGTLELSTGLQISGTFTRSIIDEYGAVAFIQTSGPTALSCHEKELIGHGTIAHPQGFGSPVGKLKGINLAIEDMSPRDLKAYDIYEGKRVELEFQGGIQLKGTVVTGTRNLQGKIQLITFQDCSIKYKDETLFEPDWGIFHLAVGKKIVSAFAGPADQESFDLQTRKLSTRLENPNSKSKLNPLELCYKKVSNIREGLLNSEELKEVYHKVKEEWAKEWLLLLELYEIALSKNDEPLANQIKDQLLSLQNKNAETCDLIQSGLSILDSKKP